MVDKVLKKFVTQKIIYKTFSNTWEKDGGAKKKKTKCTR